MRGVSPCRGRSVAGELSGSIYSEKGCAEWSSGKDVNLNKDRNGWRMEDGGCWSPYTPPSIRVRLGCSRDTCCWSRCRCRSDSTSSQAQPLLPWRWAWRSCGGAWLWSRRRRAQAPRVDRLLSPSLALSSCPSPPSVAALSPSAGCWLPAGAASPYWWDWSSSRSTWPPFISPFDLRGRDSKHGITAFFHTC